MNTQQHEMWVGEPSTRPPKRRRAFGQLRIAVAVATFLVTGMLLAAARASGQVRFGLGGEWSLEARGFLEAPQWAAQHRHDASILVSPETFVEWGGGDHVIVFEPFARIDVSDGSRSHLDIRTLAWERSWRTWELRIGVRRVFWGVTESNHLVDVINQTDLVEDPDGEDKLGQPMVNLAWIGDLGTLDLFLMSGFRERTFPGVEGRLRPARPVDTDQAVYESARGRWNMDWAVRWSRSLGEFDLGVSHFVGTNRDPRLLPGVDAGGLAALVPHYDRMNQTSLDAQWTHAGWLLKLEALTRDAFERYWAMVGGVEYTLNQVFGTSADVGLLAELSLDSRGSEATTPFQDDVFLGTRVTLNDVSGTEILAGALIDRDNGGTLLQLEASRRSGEHWTVGLTGRAFLGVHELDPFHGLRRDGYLEVAVRRWW